MINPCIARWYKADVKGFVICNLCPHLCHIKEGKAGICQVRQNVNGQLHLLTYGKVAALHMDPIEKKPLYHFYPGRHIFSVGSIGCNLDCDFCQNHEISQADPGTYQIAETYSPANLVAKALAIAGNIGIAYTYNEPVVWSEYILDTATIAKDAGLKNAMITNGYINEEPLGELLLVIDAFSVDLKGFSESFYNKTVGGRMEPVLKSLKQIRKAGKHLEIVNLVIPQLNDDKRIFRSMIQWISNELGDDTVLHLSRYFPKHRLGIEPTPLHTLEELGAISREFLKFVYTGNVQSGQNDTLCPNCGHMLISRHGYSVTCAGLDTSGKCISCSFKLCDR
ncbi:MAG: AmmeMemoRadiSam system radical SAM enzyme [Bacteroidales bacterium]